MSRRSAHRRAHGRDTVAEGSGRTVRMTMNRPVAGRQLGSADSCYVLTEAGDNLGAAAGRLYRQPEGCAVRSDLRRDLYMESFGGFRDYRRVHHFQHQRHPTWVLLRMTIPHHAPVPRRLVLHPRQRGEATHRYTEDTKAGARSYRVHGFDQSPRVAHRAQSTLPVNGNIASTRRFNVRTP